MADIQVASPVMTNEFVHRVAALPSVEAAIGVVYNSYNKIKEMSPAVVTRAIEVGETAGTMALSSSTPILEKFSGPINYVDHLACQTLDKVEEKAPIVKDKPEVIMEQVKQYGYQKVNSARELGSSVGIPSISMVSPVDKVNEYRNQIGNYASAALAAADAAMDQHLASCGVSVPAPQSGEGAGPGGEDAVDSSIITRVDQLRAKAGLCVKHHTSQSIEVVHKAAQDGLRTVTESLQAVNALRAAVTSGKGIEEVTKTLKLDWLTEILLQAKDQPASQQAVFVAQGVATHVHQALLNTSAQINERLSSAYSRFTSMAASMTSLLPTSLAGLSFDQLTTTLSATLNQQAAHLQELLTYLRSKAIELQHHLPEALAKNLPKASSAIEGKEKKQ